MQVDITEFAKSELRQIFAYYKLRASERIALQIVNKLLDSIEELGRIRGIGSIEPNLAHIKGNHKYMVCGNYKVIFLIEKDIVHITDIFDCRQDPIKLIKRNTE